MKGLKSSHHGHMGGGSNASNTHIKTTSLKVTGAGTAGVKTTSLKVTGVATAGAKAATIAPLVVRAPKVDVKTPRVDVKTPRLPNMNIHVR